MEHKHPEKWKNMLQPKETHTKLQKNEAIKMILHFILREDEEEVSHELFTIVEKENKAIAKRITSHINRERKGACNGHSDEVVEYPIEDTDILIDEMRAIISGFVHKMNDQEDIPLKTSEMIYMQITKQETNQRMIEKIQQDKTPETKEVIADAEAKEAEANADVVQEKEPEAEEPVIEVPAEEPAVEEPAVEEPTVEEPTVDAPEVPVGTEEPQIEIPTKDKFTNDLDPTPKADKK